MNAVKSDVKAAVRALRVFETFASEGRPLSLSELATRLDIPASSCLLLIRTLLRRGYLYEIAARTGYYPTQRMLDQAARIAKHHPVVERFAPVLTSLRDKTHETVALSKLQSARAIYLAIFDSPHIVRPSVTVGTLRPLHSTSVGKALLGALEEQARAKLLDQIDFECFTRSTISSRARLEAELGEMAVRGWYSNDGETVADLSGIAVPVRIHNQVYAVSVLGPSYRLNPRLREHAAALIKAAAQLGHDRSETGFRASRARKRSASRRLPRPNRQPNAVGDVRNLPRGPLK